MSVGLSSAAPQRAFADATPAPDVQVSGELGKAEEKHTLLDEVNRLDAQIDDVRGLVDALELVCWHLCQETVEDPTLARLRKAILGLSTALYRAVKD